MLRNLRLVHRASYFDECHLSLLAWGQSTQCPVQNRVIVSDSRHQKGVRNFRRIVFHSLFKLKGHVTVSSRSIRGQAPTRQRKITRGARACAGPASPQFRTFWAKNKPTSVNERSYGSNIVSIATAPLIGQFTVMWFKLFDDHAELNATAGTKTGCLCRVGGKTPVYAECSCRVQKVKGVRMNSNHTFRPRHDRGSIRPSGPAFRRCAPSVRALRPDESAIMPSPSGMIV